MNVKQAHSYKKNSIKSNRVQSGSVCETRRVIKGNVAQWEIIHPLHRNEIKQIKSSSTSGLWRILHLVPKYSSVSARMKRSMTKCCDLKKKLHLCARNRLKTLVENILGGFRTFSWTLFAWIHSEASVQKSKTVKQDMSKSFHRRSSPTCHCRGKFPWKKDEPLLGWGPTTTVSRPV